MEEGEVGEEAEFFGEESCHVGVVEVDAGDDFDGGVGE